MDYVFVFESVLYYCNMLLLGGCILGCKPRKAVLILSFLLFVPLVILVCGGNEDAVMIASLSVQVIQFPLLCWIFPEMKLRYFVFFNLLMNCVNVMLIGMLVRIFSIDAIWVDVLINILTASAWGVICMTGLRHKLGQLLLYTPKYVLIVSTFLFISMIIVDVAQAGGAASETPELWERFRAIGTSLNRLVVCVAFPVFIVLSASNSRLKLLTSQYEQQIRAQAEHYQALSEANWEVRRFRHDFKNTRIAIETLLAQEDVESALKLLRAFGDGLEAPNVLFDTGNGIADALLTDKYIRAATQDTVIAFQGAIPPSGLAPTDLCVILGNTTDNAVEACGKLPTGIRRIVSITCNYCNGFLFLTVHNPTAEKVPLRENQIVTTKQDKTLHGFGLLSLQSVVQKYKGTVKFIAEENSFTVSIDLYLPKPPPTSELS